AGGEVAGRRGRPRGLGVLVAAAALLVAVALIWIRRPDPPLSFTVEGALPGQGYVAAGEAGAAASFSEGTRVVFAPGARGRVLDVGARGARVSLEAGSARFDVVHRPGAPWIAEAGPLPLAGPGAAVGLWWCGGRVRNV